jgi:hypothetical protein
LINEVVNLQKVLLELVSNNELFNKPAFNAGVTHQETPVGTAQALQQAGGTNINILGLISQLHHTQQQPSSLIGQLLPPSTSPASQ